MKEALSVPRLLQCIDSWAKFINQSISIISIIRSMKNLAFVEVISGDCLSQHCEIIILALRKQCTLYKHEKVSSNELCNICKSVLCKALPEAKQAQGIECFHVLQFIQQL